MDEEAFYYQQRIEGPLHGQATVLVVDEGLSTTPAAVVEEAPSNWWALLAIMLVFATAAGNILVCLAITWERRLQNVTNYFLMSLAITDLMVAILVMPIGILTLVRGYFPLPSVYCLAWICLDVLFCTASIMHLCTISVDRYLSLRYPIRFGRNKTRKRVTLKIIFVWLLSIAMSMPLSLMYSKDQDSVLIDGTCQIPDPLYKLIGSIVCFYIPLAVMLGTYALTVRLLADQQRQGIGANSAPGWSTGGCWLGATPQPQPERRATWRRLLPRGSASPSQHQHSAASTDTELTTLDAHDLWLQEPEPSPCTMSALHQFGAEMLKLSRGLEQAATQPTVNNLEPPRPVRRRRASTFHIGDSMREEDEPSNNTRFRRRGSSFHDSTTSSTKSNSAGSELLVPPPCTCPYFGDKPTTLKPAEVRIVPGGDRLLLLPPSATVAGCGGSSSTDSSPSGTVVTWRRGSGFGRTLTSTSRPLQPPAAALRRTAGGGPRNGNAAVRPHHSRNSSVVSRSSSRHGRIIRLEQKATKVLGIVFFTFVILWAPFFILNLVPSICEECQRHIDNWVIDLVTWLGYASSMVNPIFYTVFNKVFRQAFKKVLLCRYRRRAWRPRTS